MVGAYYNNTEGSYGNSSGGNKNQGFFKKFLDGLGKIATQYGAQAIGLGADIYSQGLTYDQNQKLMQQKYFYDKEAWHAQNRYNTPAKQMERLKKAGLNPALMYGQGTTGNATQRPEFQAIPTQFSGARAAQAAASGGAASLIDEQKELLKANRIATLSESALKKSTKNKIDTMVGLEARDLEMATRKKQKEIELIAQNVTNQKTINELNKEYLKLEKQGYHKGNMLATIMKSVYGLDLNTQAGQETAQWIVSAVLGAKTFESLSGGLKNLLQAFRPGTKIIKNTKIGEMFNNYLSYE